MATFPPPDPPEGGAYGPAGYVAGFGNFEPPPESLADQRTRLQQKAGKFGPETDDDDLGEMDWTVTYIDMVTLLMIFFVVLSFLAMVSDKSRLNTQQVEEVRDQSPRAAPETETFPAGAYSPFDGHGFTVVEGGMPANRDNIRSRYDDPEAQSNGTTDPSPPPSAPPSAPVLPTPPEPPPPLSARNDLAERLQQMVRQNNLAGQVEILSSAQSVTVRIAEKILFASGRATLETSGITLVQRLAPVLAHSSDSAIAIEGHTDNVPIRTAIYPSNWELSAARAATVLRQLVDLGLPAVRLRAIAYADTKPVGPNDTPDHRASNRRVELVITSDAKTE